MTHHDTKHALKSRFEKIQAAFDVAITYLDSEDIHAFRVEVKKLRAFLRLVSPQEKIKLPRRLHQFFQTTGEVRNLQLQQERIRAAFPDKSHLPESYITLLGIDAADHIRHARKLVAEKISISTEEQRILQVLPDHLTRTSIREYTRKQVEGLQTFGDQLHPVGNEALHHLRKCLKGLLYNQDFIQKEAADILPPTVSAGNHTLVELIDLLGHYQDLRTGLLLLRPHYIDQVTDRIEKKRLESVRTHWEKDKASLKNRILHHPLSVLYLPTPVPEHDTSHASR